MTNPSALSAFLFATTVLWPTTASAEVKLPAIFGDHMVLRQEMKVPIWGTAEAGEKVTVTDRDHTASTTADSDGRWRVDLAPFPNGMAATTMKVAGKNTLTFRTCLSAIRGFAPAIQHGMLAGGGAF